jgi:hypothetical protein
VVKESDLEAGRTLTDVHGNLVRVDQRMMRPAADEIQFFNLVKRPIYANYTAATEGFAYNGGAVTTRLDYMQMTMNFNKDLPQRIEEWPSFFNGNDVNPDWASFVMANRSKSDEIFFIAEGYKYDAARDELVNNTNVVNYTGTLVDRNVVVTGVLNDTDLGMPGTYNAIDGLNDITHLRFSGNANGTLSHVDGSGAPIAGTFGGTALGTGNVIWAVKTDLTHSYSEPVNRPDNAPLVQYQADKYRLGTTGTDYIWFAKENYVISNGGGIQTPNAFTNTSSDPFSLLKDNALETVMYIKKAFTNSDAGITTSAQAKADIKADDYFRYNSPTAGVGTNIDIVFIPDLMIAAVQRMLPAITNLKD